MYSISKLEFNVSESSAYDKLRRDYAFKVILSMFFFIKKLLFHDFSTKCANKARFKVNGKVGSLQ